MDPDPSTSPAQAGSRDEVSVIITEPGWRRLIQRADLLALRAARAAGARGTVVLAADRTVRALNYRHRGQNKPTNVLTYAAPAPEMLLALGVIRREAAAAGRRPAHHLAHLVVHGALHLAGYDHHQAGEARRMELAEARILHRLRVPNPWKRG